MGFHRISRGIPHGISRHTTARRPGLVIIIIFVFACVCCLNKDPAAGVLVVRQMSLLVLQCTTAPHSSTNFFNTDSSTRPTAVVVLSATIWEHAISVDSNASSNSHLFIVGCL